jgi:hypothetical protein
MEKSAIFVESKNFLQTSKRFTPLLPDEIVEDHPDALKLSTRGELLAW